MNDHKTSPMIGITADLEGEKYQVGRAYTDMVVRAGGVGVILPCDDSAIQTYVAELDGFILTGGDDPNMETWGISTHPKAIRINPQRQAFEVKLLETLAGRAELPVLGVCLGMQLMGLCAGGRLDQYLPETLPTADVHWGRKSHAIEGELGAGLIQSHHRQAITDAGSLRVVARAEDGVIEAIDDPGRAFYLGVQWHPERTEDQHLGYGLFERFVQAARRRSAAPSRDDVRVYRV